jgi:5-formyltetrahydrofolate cyclo-ligase
MESLFACPFYWKSMQELRQSIRERRHQLTDGEREIAAKQLFTQLSQSSLINPCQHIAVYTSFDGEIDTKYMVDELWRLKKNVYLPVLLPQTKKMQFAHYDRTSALVLNQFNILEPKVHDFVSWKDLDVVFLPLVAFDHAGNRLGMGAGYYDATLQNIVAKPKLIGLAYEFQRVEHLVAKASDVRLHGILTEAHYYEILVT